MARRSVQNMPASPLTTRALSALVLLAPLVYWTSLRDYTLPPRLLILQIVLALTLATWLTSGVRTLRLPAFGLPATVYLLVSAVSLLYATDPAAGLLELTKILSGFLLFVVVANHLQKDGVLRILNVWVLTGAAISLLGIAEHLGWRPFLIPSAGLPSATLGYRNIAAMYLIQSIPMALGLFAVARSRTAVWTAALATALMSAFLVYTRTRGAWIGLAGAALIALCFLITTRAAGNSAPAFPRLKRAAAAVALALFLALTLLPSGLPKVGPQSIDEKKAGIETAVTSILSPGGGRGRLTMWRHTLEMIADRPILGVGLDNWEFTYPPYDRGDKITVASEPVRPHNDFLWIASELGLVGLTIYLWLLVTAATVVLHLCRTGTVESRLVALASAVGLLALLGHSLFSFPKEQPASAMFFWLHLAFLGVLSSHKSGARRVMRALSVVPVLGVVLSLGALSLGWRHLAFDQDYHLARRYEDKERWAPAAETMSRALEAGTFDHRARFLLARYLQREGKPAEAETAYGHALEAHPNYAHTHHNLGRIYAAEKAWPKAIAHYRRALKIRPGYIDVRIQLGHAYLATGRPGDAVGEFQAVRDDGHAAGNWLRVALAQSNLGAAHLHQGEVDIAIAELMEAVRPGREDAGGTADGYEDLLRGWLEDPAFKDTVARAYNNLAYAYELKGRYEEAVAAYESLLKLWDSDLAYRKTVQHHVDELRNRIENGNR